MAKFSRACLGALVLASVALPVLSAEQKAAPRAQAATAKASPEASSTAAAAPTKVDPASKQQRMEELGEALRRIQEEQAPAAEQPAAPAKAAAKAEAPVQDPNQFVSVKVSPELEASASFKSIIKEVPHTLMTSGTTGSDLLMKQSDVAELQKSVDSKRHEKGNAKLDQLAESLRAVQSATIDLSFGGTTLDAVQQDPAAAPAAVPTPAQVDAQALGTPAAPAAPAGTPGVFGAAPPANQSEPAPAAPAAPAPGAPATPAAPAEAPAAPAPAPAPEAPAVPAAPAPEAPAAPAPPAPRVEEAPAAPSPEANAAFTSKLHAVSAKGDENMDGVSSDKGSETRPIPADALEQRVNLDFREMELTNVVALLASKAGINVIAGTDLTGTVTANLRNVPLRQAIETALRMNGLGMIEEEGIYRIVTYEESIANKRVNQMITLKNAKADEVQKVLQDIIKGSQDERHVNVSANQSANLLVISGPESRVPQLVAMANQLDIAEPVLPTVTEAIKLNYSEPKDVIPTVTAMLSKDVGKVAIDERSRHLIVTDIPVNVETVREMLKELDQPVKTVAVETMVVDVSLTDDTETGVDWVVNLVRSQSRREAAKGDDGRFISDVQKMNFDTSIPGAAEASTLTFGLLTGNIDWTGLVKAEIKNFNGKIMSAPSVLTVENKPATITIAEEIPYIELVQTAAGGQQNKTSFKEVGTIMEVTPRVTHDNYIISQMRVKESNTSGTFQNIPIENKRELSTSLRTANGQTVFMGGLRKSGDELTVRKVPVLGDIPVVNYLFRNNKKNDRKNEMVVFMTCNVVNDNEELTPYQQDKLDAAADPKLEVNGGNETFEYTVHPGELRDPVWKYRRTTR